MSSTPVHLVVIIHGLWGAPEHVAYLANTLARTAVSSECLVDIFCPQSISGTTTYDGIDFCAELVSQEVDQRRHELEKDGKIVTKFSCVGYSLGGLIARFLVGLLHSRTPSFFESVEAMNFTTFASPWVGVPKYSTWVGSIVHFFGSKTLSRTGQQLHLHDKYHCLPNSTQPGTKFPLITLLAHPKTNFFKALTNFKTLTIYANAILDRTVPFVTGAAEKIDCFQLSRKLALDNLKCNFHLSPSDLTEQQLLRLGGLELQCDANYPAIVQAAEFVGNSSPSLMPLAESAKATRGHWFRFLPKLPFFLKPSTYPFPIPFNYLAVLLSPVLVPAFLVYIVGLFCYQSVESQKRIRKYSVGFLGNHSQRLKRVGLIEELEQSLIEDFVGIGNENFDGPRSKPIQAEQLEGNLVEADARSSGNNMPSTSSAHGTKYSSYLADELYPKHTLFKDQGLSQLQVEMIENINQLPHLAKYFAFFDNIVNSHGAIIYRVEGLSDRRGKFVGKHWTQTRFIV
ncbi:hypothetical protein O181_059091 [Austropuccinia psidii MF-1]|uniref:DUF676 domain-containing protein n=1 Tax=Austropuccinia psidii MF-1 TaxID=1389203 RepID=A0A9Q3EBK0_9BASI|nr:hypothetical protein [Austropuccinia psidii MF-1]